jgi:hypothetical protein
MLAISWQNPSEAFVDLKPVSESSTARKLRSPLDRASNGHVRPRTHLRAVESKRRDVDVPKSNLRPEQINQCMLLLLVICILLAGAIVGAASYFAGQWR